MDITITLTIYKCLVQIKRADGQVFTKEFKSVENLVKSIQQSIRIKEFDLKGKVKINNKISLGFFSTYYNSLITGALQG